MISKVYGCSLFCVKGVQKQRADRLIHEPSRHSAVRHDYNRSGLPIPILEIF